MAGRVPAYVARFCLPLIAAACATAAPAQDAVRARQNIEYRLIAPQPVDSGGKIEVIEFFWYGCPFCNDLQPALEGWLRRKPADVVLRRVPAILRDSWAPHARIYFTLELLGEAERLHRKVYDGYHLEALHLTEPDVLEQWAVRNGIDRSRWLDAYRSPEVAARVARASQSTQRYEVTVTPSLVVDGRYLTSSGMTGDVGSVIPVVEDLVRLARQKRGDK